LIDYIDYLIGYIDFIDYLIDYIDYLTDYIANIEITIEENFLKKQIYRGTMHEKVLLPLVMKYLWILGLS